MYAYLLANKFSFTLFFFNYFVVLCSNCNERKIFSDERLQFHKEISFIIFLTWLLKLIIIGYIALHKKKYIPQYIMQTPFKFLFFCLFYKIKILKLQCQSI